jgi:imidazolonepropionase-like amidohydrolase
MEGTISEGKNADLVLLNKNPLTDIKNTKTIEGVFLKGKWYDRSKIDLMLKQVEAAFK